MPDGEPKMNVPLVLCKLREALQRSGVDYLLIGGAARIALGLQDETPDLDLLDLQGKYREIACDPTP